MAILHSSCKKHYTNITILIQYVVRRLKDKRKPRSLHGARRLWSRSAEKFQQHRKAGTDKSKHCPVIFTQDGSDIDKAAVLSLLPLQGGTVGITAGASTPAYIIKEVHRIMSEILNNEEGFDFMAEVDKTFKKYI